MKENIDNGSDYCDVKLSSINPVLNKKVWLMISIELKFDMHKNIVTQNRTFRVEHTQ